MSLIIICEMSMQYQVYDTKIVLDPTFLTFESNKLLLLASEWQVFTCHIPLCTHQYYLADKSVISVLYSICWYDAPIDDHSSIWDYNW